MGGTYTIYAYFNSGQIQGVLNAIVMLVGSGGVNGDYLSIIRVAAMLGLFIAVTLGFVKARGEDAAQYLIMVAIFYSVLFVPRVSVTIEEVGGSGGAPVVVDNVPLGLAFFASTTSHIGYWLTDKTETFFSLPSTELQLNKHGLMGGARALREAQAATIPDPVLQSDMVSFMRDCINPELLSNPPAIQSLMTSTNLFLSFSTLGLVNPGRMVTFLNAGNLNCQGGYIDVGSRLSPAVVGVMAEISAIISPASTQTAANAIFASMFPAAESLIMTSSASAADAIKQRMMINMMNDTSSNLAQIMDDPAAAQAALGTAMASASANSGYRITAKLAAETLPIIRNAIELVIIGVFPIVLILIIIAGSKGGVVLRSYVMTMLWVQLWAPIYAIVNYVGTLAHARSARASLAGIDGLTISNAAAFVNATISSEAMVGILTIAVPMIALALVKGGEVATAGIASSMTGGATSAATKAGESVAAGNVQMGNTSWGNGQYNNVSANKSNTDGQILSGAIQTRAPNGNVTDRMPDGTTVGTVPQHSGPFKTNTSATASSGLRLEAANKIESAFNHSVAAGNQAIAALNTMSGRGSDNRATNTVGDTGTTGYSSREGDNYSKNTSRGNTVSFDRGVKKNAATSATTNIGLRGGGGFDSSTSTTAPNSAGNTPSNSNDPQTKSTSNSKLSGSAGLGAEVAQQAKNDYYKAIANKDTAGANKATAKIVEYVENASKTHAEGNTNAGSDTSRRDISASLSSAKSHLEESRSSLSEAKTLTDAANITKGEDSSASYTPINPLNTSAESYFGTYEQLAHATPEGRGQLLENIRSQSSGEPTMPENHLSGDKVVGTRAGIAADHADNNERSEVADTTKSDHAENEGAVGAGPTGQGSAPLSKKEALHVNSHLDHAGTVAKYQQAEGEEAASSALNIVDKSTGQVGNSVKGGNADEFLEPATTNGTVADAIQSNILNGGGLNAAGFISEKLSGTSAEKYMNEHGYEVRDMKAKDDKGELFGGFDPEITPKKK